MRAAGRPHVRAALVALAMLASGCDGCGERSRPSEEESTVTPEAEVPEGRPAPPRRMGVKVPMPSGLDGAGGTGWQLPVRPSGAPGAPGGPAQRPGRAVALRRGPRRVPGQTFEGFERSLELEEGGEDFTLVRVTLAPKLADGGVGRSTRRSSAPGAWGRTSSCAPPSPASPRRRCPWPPRPAAVSSTRRLAERRSPQRHRARQPGAPCPPDARPVNPPLAPVRRPFPPDGRLAGGRVETSRAEWVRPMVRLQCFRKFMSRPSRGDAVSVESPG